MSAVHHVDAPATSRAQFFERYGGTAPENYERFFVPAIGAPLAADLIDAAALRPGERVLDVACGTGVVTRLAASRVRPGGSVAGLDLNPGMLAVATSATPPDLLVAWHQASADAMPFPGDAFDVALCQLGLQFMADRTAALCEIRRVLSPGGRLILNVPGPAPRIFAIMDEALGRHIGPQASAFMRAVFSLHDPDEIRTMLAAAGFRDVDVRPYVKVLRVPPPVDFLWQYVQSTPLAAQTATADDRRREALERDAAATLREFVTDGGMTLHQGVVIAIGRK